jgi:tetratricopeptide (TPR) repeat protein
MKKLLMLLLLPAVLWAQEDDMLSILENQNTANSVVNVQVSPEIAKIKGLVGGLNPEQVIFFNFLNKGDFKKALFQWSSAFSGSAFASSDNGKTLHAFLLYKNGLEIFAFESLLATARPQQVSAVLKSVWNTEVTATANVVGLFDLKLWNPGWKDFFGAAVDIKIKARDEVTDLAKIEAALLEAQPDSPEYSSLVWQKLILTFSQDPKKAAQSLAQLLKHPAAPVSVDLMNMTAARLLFQSGYLDAAIKYYEKIGKKSDYWFEAQEEIAWSYLRKGEPQNALAVSKSITLPDLALYSGPEAMLMRSLAELKVCDYPGVMKTLSLYKTVYQPRTGHLLKIDSQYALEISEQIKALITTQKSDSLTVLKAQAVKVPRFALRDQAFRSLVYTETQLATEADKAGHLYAQSISEGTGKVGFQATLEMTKKNIEARLQASKAARADRIRVMAEEEVQEIKAILQKLHVVEAELLSQTSLADRVKDSMKNELVVKSGSTGSKDKETLTFAGTNEIWFDEISNFRVDVKGACGSVRK